MTIAVGDRIPDVRGDDPGPDGPIPVQTGDVLGSGKVVLFAVPGAFTPTCSDYHLPSYRDPPRRAEGQGGRHGGLHLGQRPLRDGRLGRGPARSATRCCMLADGNGEFTKAVGLEMDGSGFGLGTRSQRYAMVIDDGVVTALNVEPGPGLTVSAADADPRDRSEAAPAGPLPSRDGV